jgi:hypothetical protein
MRVAFVSKQGLLATQVTSTSPRIAGPLRRVRDLPAQPTPNPQTRSAVLSGDAPTQNAGTASRAGAIAAAIIAQVSGLHRSTKVALWPTNVALAGRCKTIRSGLSNCVETSSSSPIIECVDPGMPRLDMPIAWGVA